MFLGTFLVVQWLRPYASNAGGLGSIPSCGTRCHIWQLRPSTAKLKKNFFNTFLKFLPSSNKHAQCAQILNSNIFSNKKNQGSFGKWLLLKLRQGQYKMKHAVVLKKTKGWSMSRRYGSQLAGAPKTKLGEFESKNNIALYQSIKKCPEVHTYKNKWLKKWKKRERRQVFLLLEIQ